MNRTRTDIQNASRLPVLAGAFLISSEMPLLANPPQSSQSSAASQKQDDSLPDAPQAQTQRKRIEPAARTRSLRSRGSEGRARERRSSGPACGRGSGARPSTRSSLTSDQVGLLAGAGIAVGAAVALSERSPSRPPGAHHRAYLIAMKPRSSDRTDDRPTNADPQTSLATPVPDYFLGNRRSGKDHADRAPLVVPAETGPSRVAAQFLGPCCSLVENARRSRLPDIGSRPTPDQNAERSLVPKNNKHIRKWYLTAARVGILRAGCCPIAPAARRSTRQETADVVIFDRYVYDQIANIYSQSFAARTLRQDPFEHDASSRPGFCHRRVA